MGLFDFLSLNKKAVSNTNVGSEAHWITMGGASDAINEANLLAANQEWVYIAVDKVALSVASVRFKVMRYSRNQDDVELYDGPLVDFLAKPGINFTGKDFIYLNTVYKELTGNAFWKPVGRKLSPIVATEVRPEMSGSNFVGYRHGNIVYGIGKILHDRYIDPARPYWGVGKLSKIAKWVDTSVFANDFLRMFFVNGAAFGGFLETDEESLERIKLIKAGLANDHVGVKNAHKLGVLPKGTKYSKTMASMKDIEMGATDDRYRDKILAAFGVPKSIVGLVEDVNRANAEANEYVFAKYTVKPIVEDFVEFLNAYIAPMLDSTGATYFDYDDFIPEDRITALEERKVALGGRPYKTLNEVRAEAGLPPVEGGDEVAQPMSAIGSPTPNSGTTPQPGNSDDPDVPEPAKDFKGQPRHFIKDIKDTSKTESAKRVPYGVRKIAHRAENKSVFEEKLKDFYELLKDNQKDIPVLEETDVIAHKAFASRADDYRDQIETAVKNFNSRQQSQVLQDVTNITKSVSKPDLFNMADEVTALVDVVSPILYGLLTEQGIAEFEALGVTGPFDNGTEIVRNVIAAETSRFATSYNETTAELLKQELDQGINAGDSLAKLTERVQAVYQYSDTVRAKQVAHTEAFYTANKANEIAWEQSTVVEAKRWFTAEDDMICEFCRPMHGRIIGLKDNYFAKGVEIIGADGGTLKSNYRVMDVPPLHPNCRCFIRPALIRVTE